MKSFQFSKSAPLNSHAALAAGGVTVSGGVTSTVNLSFVRLKIFKVSKICLISCIVSAKNHRNISALHIIRRNFLC
jgi:hypothetical protein